jgi:hypothetical protein
MLWACPTLTPPGVGVGVAAYEEEQEPQHINKRYGEYRPRYDVVVGHGFT